MIVSTPGRLCLFGEHQDYLGLPVIAAVPPTESVPVNAPLAGSG
jgi:galactokinase